MRGCLKAAVFSGLVAVRSFLSLIGTAAELRSVRAASLRGLGSRAGPQRIAMSDFVRAAPLLGSQSITHP